MRKAALLAVIFGFLASPLTLLAFEPDTSDTMQLDVAKAIIDVKKSDPGISKFFEGAAGYALFP